MASINGITIKKLKKSSFNEGESFQGELYIGDNKIGFWSRDIKGDIVDNVKLDSNYSENLLFEQIEKLNVDKIVKDEKNLENVYTVKYSFEHLMTELLSLIDDERAFIGALKDGYSMTVYISDGYNVSTCPLPEFVKLSDEELKTSIGKMLNKYIAICPYIKNDDMKIKIYRALDDFNIGQLINIEDIYR